MEEQKVPRDEHKNPEEEYSFLQEVIKDETGGRKMRNSILHVVVLGFIFGIVACFGFSVSKPWIENKLGGDPEQVTIPRDEQDEKKTDGEKAEEEKADGEEQTSNGTSEDTQKLRDKNKTPDAESYRRMLQSLRDTAKVSGKSIVKITGITEDEKDIKDLDEEKGSISGVIIADNGRELLILGKTYPVKHAELFLVEFSGGDVYEAEVKARDENLGLSIYGIRRSVITDDTWTKIDTAVLGNSNLVNTGDAVIVLGQPFGNAGAYTYGLISADSTKMDFSDGQYEVIYTDVSGSGNGSGVIVNIRGEIIGMIDQTLLEEDSRNLLAGYGISDIKEVIERLSNGKSIPYIGIYGVDVTEDMKEQGLPQGIYVKEVETDSPAMAAGIQNGDVITSMDGKIITDIVKYHDILMKKSKEDNIVLKGCRQGAKGEYVDINFSVTIGVKK